ncbi:MAG: cyclic nucleotide-binding domain-containing protein, partial [Myxococcota bacterium]
LFLVEEGELEVLKGERRVLLTTLSRGDYFGEMSFIDMQPRSATVRVTQPGALWRWPYGQLHAVYRSQPKAYTLLVMNIARQLSRRLRRADEAIGRRP